MVSISIDHNIENWKKALIAEKMPWPNLSNLPGDHTEITSRYNIRSVPSIFLLDGNKNIVLADADFSGVEAEVEKLVHK